jgi:hypothetical protein
MSVDLIDNPNVHSSEDAGVRYVGDDRPGYARRDLKKAKSRTSSSGRFRMS